MSTQFGAKLLPGGSLAGSHRRDACKQCQLHAFRNDGRHAERDSVARRGPLHCAQDSGKSTVKERSGCGGKCQNRSNSFPSPCPPERSHSEIRSHLARVLPGMLVGRLRYICPPTSTTCGRRWPPSGRLPGSLGDFGMSAHTQVRRRSIRGVLPASLLRNAGHTTWEYVCCLWHTVAIL